MGMIEAYKLYWKNYTNFSGRSRRSEFWYAFLCNMIIGFIFYGIIVAAILIEDGEMGPLYYISYALYGIYCFAVLVPTLSLYVRRMHDIGKSGWTVLWCYLLCFVCGIGSILLIVHGCKDSVMDNQWGPNPKKMVGYGMYNGMNNGMNNGMYNGMNGGQYNGMNGGQYNGMNGGQYNGMNNGMNNGQYNGMNNGQYNGMNGGQYNGMNNDPFNNGQNNGNGPVNLNK